MTVNDERYWALYLQMTREVDGETRRHQMIFLPPIKGRAEFDAVGEFRFWERRQRSSTDKARWRGPYGRRLETLQTYVANVISIWERDGYTDPIVVTVPMSEPELLNLRYEGKKTEYRVMDRARRIVKKKYKREIR